MTCPLEQFCNDLEAERIKNEIIEEKCDEVWSNMTQKQKVKTLTDEGWEISVEQW